MIFMATHIVDCDEVKVKPAAESYTEFVFDFFAVFTDSHNLGFIDGIQGSLLTMKPEFVK